MTPFRPCLDSIHVLPAVGSWPITHHQFESRSVSAVRAALAARRPLLVRGEPGVGKSQLARAAAHYLNWPFFSFVVNARSEVGDLLYYYDAVSRLAEAQVAARQPEGWEAKLAEPRFVRPGVLWWAFDWHSANRQAETYCRDCPAPAHPPSWQPGQGSVLLIDEIDKADSDLPNSLLEALGNTGFQVEAASQAVALPSDAVPPLIIITTNEERELPAAFLRRCLVLHMTLPDDPRDYLIARGRVHCGDRIESDAVFQEAARQLILDRETARERGLPPPGPAEYLDLIRALSELAPNDDQAQLDTLNEIRDFALRKHPDDLGQ